MDILPSWITRAGLRFLLITDVMVVGVFAHSFLAAIGIAYSLGGVLYSVGQGLFIGCLTLTAAEPNASPTRNATILRDGLVLSLVSGAVLALLCQTGTGFLNLMGQEAEIAEVAGPFLMLLGLGLPLHYGFMTIGYMLEAKGHRQIVAFWVGAAFLLNLCLGLGLAVGLESSAKTVAWSIAVSTLAVRSLALLGIVATFRARVALVPRRSLPRWTMATGRDMRRIGLAAGAGLAIESAAFAMLSVYAGWLGAQALAAYTMLVSLVTVIFSLALAVAVLTATRIAAERPAARRRFLEGMAIPLARGVQGLLEATALASFTVLFLLSWRFWRLTQPPRHVSTRERTT